MGTPITCIKYRHTYVKDSKRDSSEANNMQAILYICVGSEVMLTSNLWTEVVLHNGAEVKQIDFVYIDSSGPKNGGVHNAVVVQFIFLSGEDDIQPFLDGYPRSVAIPMNKF